MKKFKKFLCIALAVVFCSNAFCMEIHAMIKVDLLCEHDGELIGFEISGHAGDDVKGKDIICAAVSSAAYMTANTIIEVIHATAKIEVMDFGKMYLKIDKSSAASCRDIMNGFKLHIIQLEEQYPKNIVVNYLEV